MHFPAFHRFLSGIN
uniref:Uncharacterized protein n=1 Tax=Anguilla anguilla TaxID=7936 RepID=A0A0E9PWV2_ANGAN